MTIFYDPRKRKVRVWVVIVFIILPILLIIFGWLGSKGAVEKEKIRKEKEASIDIFDKF